MTTTDTDQDFVGRIVAQAMNQTDIYELRQLVRNLATAYREDVAMASTKMNQEAIRRGWCSEYEGFVESLNEELHLPWPPRHRTYDVTASFTIRITRLGVRAEDDDAATNVVNFGGWYSENLAVALRNGECDWSLDDVEVEESDGE